MIKYPKLLVKFLSSPGIIALLTLRELIQFGNQAINFVISRSKDLELPETPNLNMDIQIDYFDFVLKLLIGVLLMYMFRLFFKIRDEMFIWNVVQQERALTIYKDAGGIPVAKKFVEDEKKRVREKLIEYFGGKKEHKEIDAALDKIYNPIQPLSPPPKKK